MTEVLVSGYTGGPWHVSVIAEPMSVLAQTGPMSSWAEVNQLRFWLESVTRLTGLER